MTMKKPVSECLSFCMQNLIIVSARNSTLFCIGIGYSNNFRVEKNKCF